MSKVWNVEWFLPTSTKYYSNKWTKSTLTVHRIRQKLSLETVDNTPFVTYFQFTNLAVVYTHPLARDFTLVLKSNSQESI
ncbi:uncharacterized protein LOC111713803 isoform X2 [Eurytemora carolleeae]|uniref:uncharacterized protein LOC111713803 isoform X2 n=1 Tax=Eurytemora carolleeae TaxID=1294199 RepID=UPI000C761D08|nr:uncharacterized protein LOC111713803 isoform X2 [Eurytemora carolleeae]|eukprot:XP_023344510.1 uncharacterized protein LOC111713803 isoform X2 [Eurytemora affinis]